MRRIPFLPAFFTVLTVLFVIIVAVQIRRDSREAVPPEPLSTATTATAIQGQQQNAVTETAAIQQPKPTMRIVPVTPSPEAEAVRKGGSRAAQTPPPAQPAKSAAPPAPHSPAMLTPRPSATQPPAIVRPQAAHQPVQAPQASATEKPSNSEAQEPADPDSDVAPPRLLSIEFVPPQIHDGEDATVVVTAGDDLSGVRGVSGTIGSPTGKALQGFATQREGQTDRWIGHLKIPKSAEEGLWRVRFLNMSDNASNSVTLSDARGTVPPNAVLRVVSSESDSTAPVLKNVWLDRRAMRGGEKNILNVEAYDEGSGVSLASAVFRSPSGGARIGAGCRTGDGQVWQCELSVPTCIDCGDWQLEQVTLQDKANNLATFRQENPIVQAVKVNILGDSCDDVAPTLQSAMVDPRALTPTPGNSLVTVTIMAGDDSCGLAGISGQYSGPVAGSGGFFAFQSAGNGTWVGRIQLDAHAARGEWRINSIQLTDQAHNLRIYYASDPLLRDVVFRVR